MQYEDSGTGSNRAQSLGEYGRGVDPCPKIGVPAHKSVSKGSYGYGQFCSDFEYEHWL